MKRLLCLVTVLAFLFGFTAFSAFADEENGDDLDVTACEECEDEDCEGCEPEEEPEVCELCDGELETCENDGTCLDEEGFIPYSLVLAAIEGGSRVSLNTSTGTVISERSLILIRDRGAEVFFNLPNGVLVSVNSAYIRSSARSADINVRLVPIDIPWLRYTDEPVADWGDADVAVGVYTNDAEVAASEDIDDDTYDPDFDWDEYWANWVDPHRYEWGYEFCPEKGVRHYSKTFLIETGELVHDYEWWWTGILIVNPSVQGDFGFELTVHISKAMLESADMNLWGDAVALQFINDEGQYEYVNRFLLNEDGSVAINLSFGRGYFLSPWYSDAYADGEMVVGSGAGGADDADFGADLGGMPSAMRLRNEAEGTDDSAAEEGDGNPGTGITSSKAVLVLALTASAVTAAKLRKSKRK